jgi:hypothetical protein
LKLPNVEQATVAQSKIINYLLSLTHDTGKSKAKFFINRKTKMIQEHDLIILKTPLHDHNLQVGDIGTVVLIHGEQEGYEVEFTTLDGEAIAITTLYPEQVRSIKPKEILHARAI